MLFKPESKDNATTEAVRKPSFLSRVLRRMVSLTVTLVILGGLGYIGWYAFQPKPGARRSWRGGRAPRPSGAGAGGDAAHPGRAGLSRRRRLGPRAEQRDRARPGRRQIDLGQFHRRPGRQEGRRARRDRSGDLPGAVRSGGRQEGAGRGAAGQPAARSRALPATRGVQCRLEAAGRYAERRGRPAGSAGEMPTRPRSTMRRRPSAIPRSSRRCRDAPACVRSTRATSSTPRM